MEDRRAVFDAVSINPNSALAAGRLARVVRRVASVALLVLTACAPYQPAPIDPVASAERFSARRLDAPEMRERIAELIPQRAEAWPPQAWGRVDLLAAALVLSPKIAVARAQVQVALAHETAAGQTPNPELTLQSEYARNDPHPWLYGLSLDILLRSPDRRKLEIDLAQLETSNARWQLMDAAWSVRRSVLAASSDLLAAERQVDLLDRLAAAQQRLFDLQRKRVDAGEDPADELLAAGQARIETEQQQAHARSQAAVARAALASAIGITPVALDGIAFDWPEWGEPPDTPADVLRANSELALRARADLGAAIDAYAEAETKLHQAVMKQYPQFQLSPGYYWDHGVAKFPLDVGFTLPLFNRSQGEIAEARAERELAGQRMLSVQAEIIGAIEAAERSEQVARASVAAADRGLAAARQQQKNAETSLRLGGIAASESIGTQVLALRSELEVAQMRAQLQEARNALEDALHAPLSGPELKLAQPLPVTISGAGR